MTGGLPPDFLTRARALQDAYLQYSDPVRQSGFGGGDERWKSERSPILQAIEGDGDIVDIGCANGYLAQCLTEWAQERGIALTPHGIDIGKRLIEEARRRLPQFAENFRVANGWDWRPAHRFRYVYALSDCVPFALLQEYLQRLLTRVVAPGGRLIVGAYGSRSRRTPPLPLADVLQSYGLRVAGRAAGGDPAVTEFAWVERQ